MDDLADGAGDECGVALVQVMLGALGHHMPAVRGEPGQVLLQFVPALWVPFYNSVEPSVAGIPFFYWFQLALVFVSAAVTAVVYFATERSG